MSKFWQFQTGAHCGGGSIDPEWVSKDGKRIVILWRETVGRFIENNFVKFNPEINPPIAVMFDARPARGFASCWAGSKK